MDWAEACRILGIPETATEIEIKEQYIYKAHMLHPDKNQDKPESIRKKAEAELSLVNQAYNIVSNPNNNPFRIPPKLAIEPMAIRFNVNLGQRKQTTLTVRNAGGPYTSIWIDNEPAPWLTVTGVKSITSERLPLEVALECTGIGEPDKQYTCDLTIKLENENTHTVDKAVVKIELCTGSDPAASGNEKELLSSAKKSSAEVPRDKAAAQQVPDKKVGFSFKAFLFNLLAFAILGVVVVYCIKIFLIIDQFFIMIGLIVYALLALGVCIKHGFTIGSGVEQTKMKNKK